MLINLAINSSKHTKNGTIAFCAKDRDNWLDVYVTDNGSGIAPEDLPHIFERGYGTDGGNGLGLTICRDIIESAGGSIAIEKTDQTGTTIRFTVPVDQKGESA